MQTEWNEVRRSVLARDNYACLSCGEKVKSADADIHHLLPRSMGGTDELANLITLCDGCHARHHPNLSGGLARRAMEKWAVRLARWLDGTGAVAGNAESLGPALRLFGLERFRHGQAAIVMAALSGKSILVISPTGSGKTLCFQLPALLRKGVTLVVSPLKTLMSDQVASLLGKKIPATFINSDLGLDEKTTRFELLVRGAIKLLYLAPERFFVRSEEERQLLKDSRPAFLVVDEAHCVDQWGNDFRREYGRLDEVRQKLGAPPVLAFTATAGKEMQQRILESLGIPDATVFVRDVDRPNIALMRWECTAETRPKVIASMLRLKRMQDRKVMVFVPSAKVGEALQTQLQALGLNIPFYHSKLGTPWDRETLQKRFMGEIKPEVPHIICTNAFGMGLDIPDVRLVIHWQQPASAEDLLQEFGRAGRDGGPSMAVILHDGKTRRDIGRQRFMAEKTVEAATTSAVDANRLLEGRYRRIEQVGSMLRDSVCFRQSVRDYFGGDTDERRVSISERILEWVFGSRLRKSKAALCCDSCDGEFIRRHGRLRYLERALQK